MLQRKRLCQWFKTQTALLSANQAEAPANMEDGTRGRTLFKIRTDWPVGTMWDFHTRDFSWCFIWVGQWQNKDHPKILAIELFLFICSVASDSSCLGVKQSVSNCSYLWYHVFCQPFFLLPSIFKGIGDLLLLYMSKICKFSLCFLWYVCFLNHLEWFICLFVCLFNFYSHPSQWMTRGGLQFRTYITIKNFKNI